jgi:hypothetical protein
MSDALHLTLVTPGQATQAISAQLVPFCRALWQDGERVSLVAQREEDARSIQQLRYYWGPMLGDISEQASINGQKYAKDAWHELGKRQFLPRRVTKAKVAGKARPVVSVSLGSTKGLSVKRMSAYIEQFQAWAITDLGVQFSERKWENYRNGG